MKTLLASLPVILGASLIHCTPTSLRPIRTPAPRSPEHPFNASIRPLVLWHGLGDSANSEGMQAFAQLVRDVHPGLFVHSIYLEHTEDADQKAGWFGNIWEQLGIVSAQLSSIAELDDGFDAIGFSQGGQFLRAYVEKYNKPPVFNLITFGSQHMGVADLPVCRPGDLFCLLARSIARRGVYSTHAQTHLIQAQYFRDHARLQLYYKQNKFLTSINGEVEETRNETFKKNLLDLGNFVMILFDQDTTVVPKESSWFGSYVPPEDGDRKGPRWGEEVLPMREQPLYKEDWIGLRKLDETGRVTMITCEGEHMHISRECYLPIVEQYVGKVMEADSINGGLVSSQGGLIIQH
ncbi:alpha/beta-hydrolase [Cantharellus anzutake]|uniref:alpha/beta-hydrolase n=1 Tax=Cantharellus anzutake TaxID=1750568 RepID=UPI001902E125|nr:alpha/beta-hydrolase [Cantharellus anzutake]KAF8332056.1 alpha/beta-hydrolase [Cantharellus anzutake]